jgi:hypothetical protein
VAWYGVPPRHTLTDAYPVWSAVLIAFRVGLGLACYSRRLALMLAKAVAASANRRAITAAASGKALGSIRLPCYGHTTRTMGGMAFGTSSSMLTVSWPTSANANGVMG